MLQLVRMEAFTERTPEQISGGRQQRVAFRLDRRRKRTIGQQFPLTHRGASSPCDLTVISALRRSDQGAFASAPGLGGNC